MSWQPARGPITDFIQRVGGMLVAPGLVRRRLLAGGAGGFTDLLLLLVLQMLTVHITHVVRSVWFWAASGAGAGLPGLTQVVLGVLITPLIFALGGSVLLRLVIPEGKGRERTLDQASLCVIPSVAVALAATALWAATGGASRELLGQVPGGLGVVWFLALLIFFALEARRQDQEPSSSAPEGRRALASRVAGWATALLVAVVLVFHLTVMARNPDSIRPVTAGVTAPTFRLPDLKGRPVVLRELRGKVVLLSFWATWCAPCLREMPFLERLQGDLGARGLRVLGVNVEDPAEVKERLPVLSKRHPRLTFVSGGALTANRYGVQTLPHLVLVDPQGRVAHVQIGTGGEELIKRKIGELIGSSF